MTVYIRRLREADLPSVLKVSKWLHENSRYKVFSYNESKVRKLLSLSLKPNSPVYVSVALKQGSDDILGYFHGYVILILVDHRAAHCMAQHHCIGLAPMD